MFSLVHLEEKNFGRFGKSVCWKSGKMIGRFTFMKLTTKCVVDTGLNSNILDLNS